jgi:protein gp37
VSLTTIEWTSGPNGEPGYTFNPVRGCMKVSAECTHCYAEARDKLYEKGAHWGPNTRRIVASEALWRGPVKWNREAAAAGERRKVFCASLADVMEDHPDWVEPRLRLFGLIRATPNLDWLLLTKRPENFARFLPWLSPCVDPPPVPHNVWLGTTAGTQAMADLRIPILQRTPAAVHFVSIEPQLEHIDLTKLLTCKVCDGKGYEEENHGNGAVEQLACHGCLDGTCLGVDWVICGGESGAGARPFDVNWARQLRGQCEALAISFFMKQLGVHTRMSPADHANDASESNLVSSFKLTKKQAGDLMCMPEDLRVRQWPEVRP